MKEKSRRVCSKLSKIPESKVHQISKTILKVSKSCMSRDFMSSVDIITSTFLVYQTLGCFRIAIKGRRLRSILVQVATMITSLTSSAVIVIIHCHYRDDSGRASSRSHVRFIIQSVANALWHSSRRSSKVSWRFCTRFESLYVAWPA